MVCSTAGETGHREASTIADWPSSGDRARRRRHALSVGMTTVRDRACFGIHTDREAIPDADRFPHDIDAEITELLACAKRSSTPAPQRTTDTWQR